MPAEAPFITMSLALIMSGCCLMRPWRAQITQVGRERPLRVLHVAAVPHRAFVKRSDAIRPRETSIRCAPARAEFGGTRAIGTGGRAGQLAPALREILICLELMAIGGDQRPRERR